MSEGNYEKEDHRKGQEMKGFMKCGFKRGAWVQYLVPWCKIYPQSISVLDFLQSYSRVALKEPIIQRILS